MKAYLILEDGTVFTGTSIGSQREVISEIVFKVSDSEKWRMLRAMEEFKNVLLMFSYLWTLNIIF